MEEKKTSNNSSGLTAGIALLSLLAPLIKPAIDVTIDHIDKAIENRKMLVAIPELYLKNYPLTSDQAVDVLSSCGLKATIIFAQLSDADPKLRNCIDGQVIGSEPKAKHKVEVGRTISIKCVTQEVINASQRLYEEEETLKMNTKLQRDEKIEHAKNSVIEAASKIKDISPIQSKRTSDLKLVGTKEDKTE